MSFYKYKIYPHFFREHISTSPPKEEMYGYTMKYYPFDFWERPTDV